MIRMREVMGPMLLLVLGILSAVGLGLYQFGEHHRFDLVSDAKGGIFIIDRKSAAINYCNDKTCSLVGNGSLPSQIMGNPVAMMSVQGSIMGAPAAPTSPKPGIAPNGMQANIAASGAPKPATTAKVTATDDGQDVKSEEESAPTEEEGAETNSDETETTEEGAAAAPEEFAF